MGRLPHNAGDIIGLEYLHNFEPIDTSGRATFALNLGPCR